MSDAEFVEAILRHLEELDSACLDFIDADHPNPLEAQLVSKHALAIKPPSAWGIRFRDPQLVDKAFRRVNACKAELLSHDLLRLDALARKTLQSAPGEWGIRFREVDFAYALPLV